MGTETIAEQLVRVRRTIHANPELSNDEVETTALIRSELSSCGITDVHLLEHSGLVADIVGDPGGPVIAVRADLDALPIQEAADVPFRSKRDGVMHACGHDVHTAMVLGVGVAARRLDGFPGTIRLIFQPAEEAEPLGARRVISAGHLGGVRGVIALHVDPGLATGAVSLRDGPMMASSDVFRVTIRGRNSHAGWPHNGADAIAAAVQFMSQIHSVIARRIDPRARAVVHFGRIVGGTANNIVADCVVIDGVIRTLDEHLRPDLRELLKASVDAASANFGAHGEVDLTVGEPVLQNDPGLAANLRGAARKVLGGRAVIELAEPTMNSEDFAFYGEHVPVAMAWIGVRNAGLGFTYPLHHPRFAVDDAVLESGSAILLTAALDILERQED